MVSGSKRGLRRSCLTGRKSESPKCSRSPLKPENETLFQPPHSVHRPFLPVCVRPGLRPLGQAGLIAMGVTVGWRSGVASDPGLLRSKNEDCVFVDDAAGIFLV